MASKDSERLRLGGMALRNGLLIHGPTHWAAAVRDRDGQIQVASERKPALAPKLVARAPGLRGPLKLAEAMAVLPLARRRLRAARLPFENWQVVAAVGVTLIVTGLLRKRAPASAVREGLAQVVGAVPAVVALMDRDLAAYHGVEHKAIAAYEQGVDDVASVPKEHDRCGSNLMVPMMLLSAGGTVLLERLVEKPNAAARAGVGLGGASIAVEMFAWSDRHHGDPLAEAFHTPGREIQRRWATKEPTAEQLEVGLAAMAEILRVESSPSPPSRVTRERNSWAGLRRLARVFGRIDHIGVAVEDLDAAIALYEQSFEMVLAHRETVESQGVEAVLLDVGDGHVELLAPLGPDTAVGKFLARKGEGLHHVAYAVDDIDAALARIAATGIELIDSEPRVGIRDSRVAFLHPRSTGGVLTEIVEPAGGH